MINVCRILRLMVLHKKKKQQKYILVKKISISRFSTWFKLHSRTAGHWQFSQLFLLPIPIPTNVII